MKAPHRPRVVVVGGGISGLAAAHRIRELDAKAEILVLEAGPRLGGVLQTERRDGFLIEYGADNFITTMPWGVEFCRRIGFEQELVPTDANHRRAFVLCRGKLQPIPAGFAVMAPSRIWPVLKTPILSPWGKLRLAAELFVPRRTNDGDESLASFVRRRLGRETYERLVQPLVAGIYTADPEQLSVDATLPRFREMERQHGSLLRGMWRRKKRAPASDVNASGARYGQFVAPRDGMSSLVNAAARCLTKNSTSKTAVRCNAPVRRLVHLPDGTWQIATDGTSEQPLIADGVVLALPSYQCARLLREVDSRLAVDLDQIEYGSCALATFGFHCRQIRHALDGFGFVVPIVERRKILSASLSSVKYPGRAPSDHVLIRTFIGGACQPELLALDDEQLVQLAQQELVELLGIDGQPVLTHVNRQASAMPQYHVGHLTLVENILDRVDGINGLALANNSLHGVGLPQCIRTAQLAAEGLLTELSSERRHLSATCP